jgi:hypothetical protein
MIWMELVKQELAQAQRELKAAQEGLRVGTDAARTRYARALHEAERAMGHASLAGRDPRWGQTI